jgi:endonuclease/exonuclease/phosphatase (EEP) superfamily protein YafD
VEHIVIKVISYNLRENHASGELMDLAESTAADVLCLQEADTTALPETIGDLKLADATKRNRLGLAVYYRSSRFSNRSTQTFALKKSLHDRVLKPAHERLIGTRLVDAEDDREIIVASFHAAPLTALNSLRRTQIYAAHEALQSMGDGPLPTLMVGDYNYPWFTQNLSEKVQQKNGYELTLSDKLTYTRYRFVKGHFDFATSIGLTIDQITTMPSGASDHKPILVTASYLETVPVL